MKYVNENGDRVEIVVRADCMRYGDDVRYIVSDVLVTPPRKRKAKSLAADIRERYDYRRGNTNERTEYVRQEFVKFCTQERIDQAIQEAYAELHERIKPENAEIDYRVY